MDMAQKFLLVDGQNPAVPSARTIAMRTSCSKIAIPFLRIQILHYYNESKELCGVFFRVAGPGFESRAMGYEPSP